jgi:hypothetical protein
MSLRLVITLSPIGGEGQGEGAAHDREGRGYKLAPADIAFTGSSHHPPQANMKPSAVKIGIFKTRYRLRARVFSLSSNAVGGEGRGEGEGKENLRLFSRSIGNHWQIVGPTLRSHFST